MNKTHVDIDSGIQARRAVGQRLKAVRRLLGHSQEDMASELGIVKRSYQNYEQGKRELPARVMIALLRNHRIDVNWLWDGAEQAPRRSGDMLTVAEAVFCAVDRLAPAGIERGRRGLVFSAALADAIKRDGIDEDQIKRLVDIAGFGVVA